jgi:hypothetical protein
MDAESLTHSHPDSWRQTMDWIDLRTHLIGIHGQNADEIDHLDGKAETRERRDRAETIHDTLHSEARPRREVA